MGRERKTPYYVTVDVPLKSMHEFRILFGKPCEDVFVPEEDDFTAYGKVECVVCTQYKQYKKYGTVTVTVERDRLFGFLGRW